VGYSITALLQIVQRVCEWKKFRKLANICQRYGQLQSGTFFLRHRKY